MQTSVNIRRQVYNSIPPAPKQPLIDSSPEYRDVARYVQSSVPTSDAEKYQLLTDPFKPEANLWLVYSKQENGGFCIPCVFASTGHHGSDSGILVQHPLVSFSKALQLLTKHTYKAYHKLAIVRADEFCKVMSNQQSVIRCRMNQAMVDRVTSNQMKLASIVQTIFFLWMPEYSTMWSP